MKSYQRPILSATKTGSISRQEARKAAIEVKKGARSSAKQIASRDSWLWQRYLGHFGSDGGPVAAQARSTRKRGAAKKGARKKSAPRKSGKAASRGKNR